MSDPRWTDETVERVADMLRSHDEEHETWLWEDLAITALDLLAEAGLLLPPGGETRTEWGAWYPSDTDSPRWQFGSNPDSEQAAREHMAEGYATRHGLTLVRRTVHTGPWVAS